MERMTCDFADTLKQGQIVSHQDLQQYCKEHHKNMNISAFACSRQMRLCPTLKRMSKEEIKNRKQRGERLPSKTRLYIKIEPEEW